MILRILKALVTETSPWKLLGAGVIKEGSRGEVTLASLLKMGNTYLKISRLGEGYTKSTEIVSIDDSLCSNESSNLMDQLGLRPAVENSEALLKLSKQVSDVFCYDGR
jgi:hypothetical protein